MYVCVREEHIFTKKETPAANADSVIVTRGNVSKQALSELVESLDLLLSPHQKLFGLPNDSTMLFVSGE